MTTLQSPRTMDVPAGVTDGTRHPAWGSDVVVDMLRLLGIEYAAVLPGSSFRGIHDSAVNYGANNRPELILVNHEMISVSMAKGYANATGRPMAAIIHNFVGLLNTSMTIYDAWCDRTPVLVLGGTGPMDATRRRPWIDWIHTVNLQGCAVRDFTKWDDQPWSVAAIPESLLRAYRIAMTPPCGPVYVCFDVTHQEEPVAGPFPYPDVSRYQPAPPPQPDPAAVREAAKLMVNAELPLVFADRVGKSAEAVRVLVQLAELLAMPVVNLGARHSFPTPHPLDFGGLTGELLAEADVVLGLDCVDLAGTMSTSPGHGPRSAPQPGRDGRDRRVINVSLDELAARGLTTDYQGLPAVDVPILAEPSVTLPLLLEEVRAQLDGAGRSRVDRRRQALEPRQQQMRDRQRKMVEDNWDHPQITEARLAVELWQAVKGEDFVMTRGTLNRMAPGVWEIPGPERHLGGGGGGAVGSGPGMSLGAALALKDTGKLPIAILGDGDYLQSAQACWTAAHYRIPSLWVIKNNRSYYNDEDHQDRIARIRERPPENKWIGMRMERPEIDLAALARSFGAEGEGPVVDAADLAPTYRRAIQKVKEGQLVVVDVRTENRMAG